MSSEVSNRRSEPDVRTSMSVVIVENVNTGRIGSVTHDFIRTERDGVRWAGTRCGIDAYDPFGQGVGSIQLSVEPEGTPVTCSTCLKWREMDEE